MADTKIPSLAEIARDTYWYPGFELAPDVIDTALVKAGISPNDQKERIRFCSLVRDAYYQQQEYEIASLGQYFDDAREELGKDASIDDVISRAYSLKEDMEDGADDD